MFDRRSSGQKEIKTQLDLPRTNTGNTLGGPRRQEFLRLHPEAEKQWPKKITGALKKTESAITSVLDSKYFLPPKIRLKLAFRRYSQENPTLKTSFRDYIENGGTALSGGNSYHFDLIQGRAQSAYRYIRKNRDILQQIGLSGARDHYTKWYMSLPGLTSSGNLTKKHRERDVKIIKRLLAIQKLLEESGKASAT